jgi:hypothetical protein
MELIKMDLEYNLRFKKSDLIREISEGVIKKIGYEYVDVNGSERWAERFLDKIKTRGNSKSYNMLVKEGIETSIRLIKNEPEGIGESYSCQSEIKKPEKETCGSTQQDIF